MKKYLALLLAVVMVFALAACGQAAPAAQEAAPAAEEAAPAEAATETAGGTIKVWVPDAAVEFTQAQIEEFKAANADLVAGFDFTVEPVGEGDAAQNMLTDVTAGADVYNFAQDQLARLVAAGALIEVEEANAEAVKAENDAGAVAAATLGDQIWAYPITSDNGYFLYYDKSVVTDPTSLEQIVADCEAAGKGVYFEINSGWYQPAFFFGAGCTLTYDTDDAGNFTACNIDYASENGLSALKAMIALHKSPVFNNGSSVSNATNIGAIVDGTWDAAAAQEALGENYACAKLPTVTVDGKTFQLGGFGGFKLLGVKPQTDEAKLAVCDALAAYLSSGDVQLARYNAVQWGPSNLEAQQNEAVKENEALSALAEQLANTIPQGQYPGDYWSLATSLGDSVIAGDYDNADDAALMEALQQFQDTCISYAK